MKRWLLILLLISFAASAQEKKPHVTYLTRDSVTNRHYIKNWRVNPGDSREMSDPEFNDRNWEIMEPDMTVSSKNDPALEKLKKVVWFRLHVHADSTVINVPLAIELTHLGASEIYVDGLQIGSFGKISVPDSTEYYDPQHLPVTFEFHDTGEHVIAIRYANFNAAGNLRTYFKTLAGVSVHMGFAKSIIDNERLQTVTLTFILILLFGVFLAIACLHLLIFLYYREIKSNLYFSLFAFSIGLYFFLIFLQRFSVSPSIQLRNVYLSLLATTVASISMSGFSNELFSEGKKRFRVISLASLLIIPAFLISVKFGNYLSALVISTVTVEAFVLTARGIVRKIPGAKIIGSGIFIFAIFFFTLAIVSVTVKNVDVRDDTVSGALIELFAGISILAIPISISAYLASSISRMNGELKRQLNRIQDLSNQTLQQEIEKKQMLARQNEELEQKVAERTTEVQQQKELLEIKNKAITDNMIYAQRIQSAILPDAALIRDLFPESFVLYLPKDIVSGDFYSFYKKGDKIIVAAGDCTGHGVSGAFMSMIGSSLINQIINEKGVTDPARILDQLNTLVIETLRQDHNESTDGMDISICAFDLKKNELQFAGANRPAYFVRNGVLEIIKPDKLPIGGLQLASARSFTNAVTSLQEYDSIYLFTDGYADQFGGENDKKMMVARFQETLLSIQHLDMATQQKRLRDYFESWQGSNEQVDDVLVIGIQL